MADGRKPDAAWGGSKKSMEGGPVFACSLTDADLVRGCAPEQPEEVKVGQLWMSVESGQSYPVVSVRDDVIQKGDLLVRLGSDSYAVLVSESDLRERYVCTDPPREVTELHSG